MDVAHDLDRGCSERSQKANRVEVIREHRESWQKDFDKSIDAIFYSNNSDIFIKLSNFIARTR